jgi:hypothetical protein
MYALSLAEAEGVMVHCDRAGVSLATFRPELEGLAAMFAVNDDTIRAGMFFAPLQRSKQLRDTAVVVWPGRGFVQ